MANNLVTATCPNCNSPLQIKEGQDFVKCEYCGTISSAPKAIEYHQHQSTSYNFSGANPVVNFSNGQDLETLVKNADMHLKLKNYAAAQSIYEKITNEYPHDYRGWWGLILARSKNLSDTHLFYYVDEKYLSEYERRNWITKTFLSDDYTYITNIWSTVKKTAPQNISNELASKYQPYYDMFYTEYEKNLYTYLVPEYELKLKYKEDKYSQCNKNMSGHKLSIESSQISIRKSTASIAWRTLLGIVSGVISLALVGYALELLFSLVIILGVLIGAVAVPFVVNTFEQRQKIKFFKDSIKDSKKAINKYNSEISECQKEIDELNKEIKKIESDMSGAKANLTKAEKKLAELTRKA